MHGRHSIGVLHGNRLRCIVLFFYYYLYMFMQSVYIQLVKVNFQSLWLSPWKQRLKNQVFKKYMVFFADHMALKVNIK